jgi:hypothetical protein
MKQFLLVIILLLVTSLIAACGAELAQPELEPAQAAEPAGAQPETTAKEALPPAAAETQPQAAAPAIFEPQANSEQAVTVQVTPLNLPEGSETLDFEVAFNTHSVDLSFDPAAISVLRDDQGREYPAAGWEGSEPGGHHRSGVLKFTAPENMPAFVEVIIRDVAGVPERVFRWELNS